MSSRQQAKKYTEPFSADFEVYTSPVDFAALRTEWHNARPFNHIVLDQFLDEDIVEAVVSEFPDPDSEIWYCYKNAIELKRAMNNWDRMGVTTYRLFSYLNSREFIDRLETMVGCPLYADPGLNGGGLHCYKSGGKLNTHLDYSIHPKLGLERRLNLIIYITPNWQAEWGGELGFWEQHPDKKLPGKLAKGILPLFNRAALFDTTQNSWHGLPEPIRSPAHISRNSLAVYYLCDPRKQADPRGRALYAPYKDQADNPEVLELIRKRASVEESSKVYRES
jgi:Rps23 Pro-64 3,4-dihydroxylase Tpa1-like proline 4-hydroxylase